VLRRFHSDRARRLARDDAVAVDHAATRRCTAEEKLSGLFVSRSHPIGSGIRPRPRDRNFLFRWPRLFYHKELANQGGKELQGSCVKLCEVPRLSGGRYLARYKLAFWVLRGKKSCEKPQISAASSIIYRKPGVDPSARTHRPRAGMRQWGSEGGRERVHVHVDGTRSWRWLVGLRKPKGVRSVSCARTRYDRATAVPPWTGFASSTNCWIMRA